MGIKFSLTLYVPEAIGSETTLGSIGELLRSERRHRGDHARPIQGMGS